MVQEHASKYPPQWATSRSVAEKLGCTEKTLRRRVRQAGRDAGRRPGLRTDEHQRLDFERENCELKHANEILKKASAYFAQGRSTAGRRRHLEAVEFATLEWVDWFNRRRLLESIDYLPSAEYKARYYAQAAVA